MKKWVTLGIVLVLIVVIAVVVSCNPRMGFGVATSTGPGPYYLGTHRAFTMEFVFVSPPEKTCAQQAREAGIPLYILTELRNPEVLIDRRIRDDERDPDKVRRMAQVREEVEETDLEDVCGGAVEFMDGWWSITPVPHDPYWRRTRR